jgi:hypothetical protein
LITKNGLDVFEHFNDIRAERRTERASRSS